MTAACWNRPCPEPAPYSLARPSQVREPESARRSCAGHLAGQLRALTDQGITVEVTDLDVAGRLSDEAMALLAPGAVKPGPGA